MINKLMKIGLIMGASVLLPAMAEAQVLMSVPEKEDFSFETSSEENGANPEYHLGMTMTGSSGLITIPAPDYIEDHKFGITVKGSEFEGKFKYADGVIKYDKSERNYGIRYNPTPALQISLSDTHYKRTNKYRIKGVEGDGDIIAAGLKYTAGNDNRNYCFGFTFAPMDSDEMNAIDIEQLENNRNVYFTMSEKVSSHFNAYLNIGTSFTKKQEIQITDTDKIEFDTKTIVYGGIGAEYLLNENVSFFGEFKVANYRDFEAYKDSKNRHRAHVGARIGTDKAQVEVIGLNVTGNNPTFVLGGNFGF